MPTYEYACDPCRTVFKTTHRIGEQGPDACPECRQLVAALARDSQAAAPGRPKGVDEPDQLHPELISQLPPEHQQELERIATTAAVDSQRNALLVLAGATLLALGIATVIPRGGPRQEERVEPGPRSALR